MSSLGIAKRKIKASKNLKKSSEADGPTRVAGENKRPTMPVIKMSSQNDNSKSDIVETLAPHSPANAMPPPSDGKRQRRKARPPLIHSATGARRIIRNKHKHVPQILSTEHKIADETNFRNPGSSTIKPTQFSYRNIGSIESTRGIRGSKLHNR